ncbi:tetratricopeptide repeat protein [Allosphingosinicella sp.]|jgi:tetratricopeptide (TPR) repeat protein|uniref:tetratricopeptide repeat protein n=1 Tax=Allosphingosinicella sp. TaxID=2823234 RepID=UPI002EF5AAB4
MMSVSRIALGAALALGGSAVLFTSPADAQRAASERQNRQRQTQPQAAQTPAQPAGRQLQLSPQERPALIALEAAVRGTDRAAQDAALAAALAVATSPDARYATARYQLQMAAQRQDAQLLRTGLDAVIASGRAIPEELPVYLSNQAQLAISDRDFPKAERALVRLMELRPNDLDVTANLAQIRLRQGNNAEALQLIQRAIAARQAAGQKGPESWYRFALASAYNGTNTVLRPQSIALARSLVTAYPTAVNWRDALHVYRDVGTLDAGGQVDLSRLMRVTGALAGERDYHDFAFALNQGGYPAEARAVLDEGVARRVIDATRSPFRELIASTGTRAAQDRAELAGSQRGALAAATGTPALRAADAFLGHARYPEAIALYRTALQKGGVDANVVNTRLGIALALAGQRAEAQTAFRAVTGPRAEMAAFWLLWLQQPAS